ncbi:MAG: ATP-dependent Clp protease ATP-binding subunit, partial [Anaerolineae bacterium]|nr:ATP-dependent Clp protease ATP-binding subunit [Anaerolineae bacterium]
MEERFDQFTERAQEAAVRAYEILQRYGHTQVDTEHLLLALIEQPEGMIPEILEHLGVEPQAVRHRLDQELQSRSRSQIYGGGAAQVYITPKLKRVMDQSKVEASKLKDDYISTEHLFLAIANEKNSAAARVLAEFGLTRP